MRLGLLLLACLLGLAGSRAVRAETTGVVTYYTEHGPMYFTGTLNQDHAGTRSDPLDAACSSWFAWHTLYLAEAGVYVFCGDWGASSHFETQNAVDVYSHSGRPWWLWGDVYTIDDLGY